MKTKLLSIHIFFLIACLLLLQAVNAQPRGRIVINEYMPWTSNTCGVNSEFVELMNFGPGPVDLGCYILTTGKYSVTIPPHTIVQPGQYYVLAGEDYIPGKCANIDSTSSGIHANLNWTTCNCTNIPIPTTGDGMMVDGGTGNTPIVLLDPSLKVIDAAVRNLPTEPVGPITTPTLAGGCASKTFDLGTMNVKYEVLGMSAGRANSFARWQDGDCTWIKSTQQSANASNHNTGNVEPISYLLSVVKPTSCGDTSMGSASIYVNYSDYSAIFPMSYTLAYDANDNGTFDSTDQYSSYKDSTSPNIEINNLAVGRYRMTVESVNGCYLKTFDFTIIPCNPSTLPVKLVYFKNIGSQNNQHQLEWQLENTQGLQSIVLEKATQDQRFIPDKIFMNDGSPDSKIYSTSVAASLYEYYRLKVTSKNGKTFYSPIINTDANDPGTNHIWPNPVTDILHLQLNSSVERKAGYTIFNANGIAVGSGTLQLNSGENIMTLPTTSLQPGIYQLQVSSLPGAKQANSFRFVKH